MCVKAPDYLKDMLVRAKLQFEGFDDAKQPEKPHRESVQPVFALCHGTWLTTPLFHLAVLAHSSNSRQQWVSINPYKRGGHAQRS